MLLYKPYEKSDVTVYQFFDARKLCYDYVLRYFYISFEFIEGPNEYMLLGTGFLLYSATKMEGLKITKIER